VACIAVIAVIIFAAGRGKETGNVTPTTTPVPTAGPTVTAAPTSEPANTVVPTETAAPIPTAEPAATSAPIAEPTKLPEATAAPTVTDVPVPTNTAAPTVTAAVTATPEPAATAVPTAEPTEVPVVPTEAPATIAPTEVPVVTATPTMVPTVTLTPNPSPTPMPTATSTPVPTSTPTPLPTSTPTPTPVVSEDVTPDLVYQAGDNVWYKYYSEEDLLAVTGTGATWDFEGYTTWTELKNAYGTDLKAKTIIIEEGITRIGNSALSGQYDITKVIFPDSLKEIGEYAFRRAGRITKNVTWKNLHLSKIDVASNAFYEAYGLDTFEGSAEVMCTPTPLPTATPTPTPNPEKPRQIGEATKENYLIDVEADTKTYLGYTTVEYWDDGSIYIKGTGDVFFGSYKGESLKEYYNKNVFKQVYIEEGITHISASTLGKILSGIKDESGMEYFLPSTMDITTLTKVGNTGGNIDFDVLLCGDIVHGYYNGDLVTLKFIANEKAVELAKEHNVVYNTTERYHMKDINEILPKVSQTGTVIYTPEPELNLDRGKCYAELSIIIEWE